MTRTRRILATVATALATATTACLLTGTLTAGSVTAPEPAMLTAPLSGVSGASGAATFVVTARPTTVLLWPSSWTGGSWIVPGTPCATSPLAIGEVTTKVIQALFTSTMRRCV